MILEGLCLVRTQKVKLAVLHLTPKCTVIACSLKAKTSVSSTPPSACRCSENSPMLSRISSRPMCWLILHHPEATHSQRCHYPPLDKPCSSPAPGAGAGTRLPLPWVTHPPQGLSAIWSAHLLTERPPSCTASTGSVSSTESFC